MNTSDIFNSKPTSNYSTDSQPTTKMNNISSVSLYDLQERVAPRQISTGNNRGEMTIKGLIRVVDTTNNNKVVVMMGYSKGSF